MQENGHLDPTICQKTSFEAQHSPLREHLISIDTNKRVRESFQNETDIWQIDLQNQDQDRVGPHMQEEWRKIAMFPNYSVSEAGSVRNDETGRLMTPLLNQRGIVHVGLTKNKVQYKRSVSILVAEAFIVRPSFKFDTPINLDGDRQNNSADNLLWRPRWFAKKYIQQFQQTHPCFSRKVQNIETGEIFDTSWEAAVTLGALDRDIAFSILSGAIVPIILQHFCLFK